jgi:uncharacterized protein YdaT
MTVLNFIQRELRLINEMYFCVYNPEKGRWQVRKWQGIFPKRLSLWREFSENILTIRREKMTDEGLVDDGYMDMDMRTVDAIRASHWWKLRWKKKIAEMDWRNEMREQKADEEMEYQSKYTARRIWRHMHEPTVHQSGKWDYFKGD